MSAETSWSYVELRMSAALSSHASWSKVALQTWCQPNQTNHTHVLLPSSENTCSQQEDGLTGRHGGRNVDLLCSFSSASRWRYKITFFKCCFMAKWSIIGYNYTYLPHSKFPGLRTLTHIRRPSATDADMLKKSLNRGFPLYMKQIHHDLMVKPRFINTLLIYSFSLPSPLLCFWQLNRPSGTKRAI